MKLVLPSLACAGSAPKLEEDISAAWASVWFTSDEDTADAKISLNDNMSPFW